MDKSLKGRIAMIGGASQGLGFASAQKLAEDGCKLAICSRSSEKIEKAANRLAEITDVIAIAADLSTLNGAQKFIDGTFKEYGKTDILIHNTGGPPPGLFEDFDDDAWLNAFNLLLMSTVRLYRGVIPAMVEQKWGKIVNITSISVKEPLDNLILSNTLRSAVTSLAKTLSNKYAADGININSVAPGLFKTGRLISLAENMGKGRGLSGEEVLENMKMDIPAGRLGEPLEFAEVISFLCKPAANMINGSTICVDGGKISSLF